MNKLVFVLIFFFSQAVFADTHSDAEALFGWAETEYPELFSPPGQPSQSWDDQEGQIWHFRYYPGTANYVGLSDNNDSSNEIWVLGDVFGGMLYINTLRALLETSGFISADLGGTWQIEETITGNCPDDDYPIINTYTAAVVPTGSQLVLTSITTGTSLSGTISGNSVSLTGAQPTDDGITTINFSGVVSVDDNTISGSGSWTWNGDSGFTCSGNVNATMQRLQSAAVNVQGFWQGSWQSSVYGISGSFSTNITQQDSLLSGTINVPEIGMNGAPLKGSINGTTITFGDIYEIITFTGTLSGDSNASGTYVYPDLGDNGNWQGSKP